MGRVINTVFLGFVIALIAAVSAFGSPKGVVARGDGIVVTEADVKVMRDIMAKKSFNPTRKALEEATVRTVLFARECLNEGVPCSPAAEAEGFTRTLLLANCYFLSRLTSVGLKNGTVESFYLVHWKRFVENKDGVFHALDDGLREKIKERIVQAKSKIFIRQEFKRLCLKFKIVFSEDVS